MADPRMTTAYEKDTEEQFKNEREAFELLALIDAEFRSDPMSVQCFDLRIVRRVRECIAKRQAYRKKYGALAP